MSYICESCASNNHGWCTVKKCNGLKKMNLQNCNTYEKLNIIQVNQPTYPKPPRNEETDKKVLDEAYRVLGKREMLWNIQKQILAIKEDNTIADYLKFEVLCNCIGSIAQMQEYSEGLYEVENIIESEIDMLMLKDSKKMSGLI